MGLIQKILYIVAICAALIAALYFAINSNNYVYSFCFVVAAGLLFFTRPKRKDEK